MLTISLENEEFKSQRNLKLNWVDDIDLSGIKHSEYKGKKLTIRPIGCTEFDGLINGDENNIICGNDSFADTEQILLDYIDDVRRDRRIFCKPL
jgi:hypothetical protein